MGQYLKKVTGEWLYAILSSRKAVFLKGDKKWSRKRRRYALKRFGVLL